MMAYVKRMIKGGNVMMVKKHHSARWGKKKCVRGININKTSEKQKIRNKRRSEEWNAMFIPANFEVGDHYFTLTYAKEQRPSSLDEGHRIFTAYIQKIKRKLKRKGIELRCFEKSENTVNGNVHHHVIVNRDVSIGELLEGWVYGSIKDYKPIYSIDDMKLAFYIAKGEGAKHKVTEYKVFKTRNLIKPEEKTEVIKSESWRNVPKSIKGYSVVEDSVYNYEDELGLPAQAYMMIRRE